MLQRRVSRPEDKASYRPQTEVQREAVAPTKKKPPHASGFYLISVRELRDYKRRQTQINKLVEDRKYLLEQLKGDAAARKQAEHEREEVLAHLYQTNQRERLRLARDLHDHAGQQTTSLRLTLLRLGKHVRSRVGISFMNELMLRLDSLGADLHRVATELRPTALQDCGLSASLQAMAVDWQAANKPRITLEIRGVETGLSEEAGITLFRLTQEALTNISKHAESAFNVCIDLAFVDDSVILKVEDDGIGFYLGPEFVRDLISANRFGIIGMKERVALVGGQFTLTSTPGSGTQLHVRVPARRPLR